MNWETTFREIVSGQRKGVVSAAIRLLLWLGTFPYRLAIAIRNRRFDRGKGVRVAEIPVISVGNLTTGGTGKTPLVCYLARKLREMDLRVTVLSRGYKSVDGRSNDEALELEIRLPDVPHLQNPDRKRMADIAVSELGAEVLLLDDGFQHRQLHRDIDIVVVDATNPFGYGYVLPRGLMREPLSGIQRADVVVLNRSDLVDEKSVQEIKAQLRLYAPRLPIALAETKAKCLVDSVSNEYALKDLKTQKVLAFCGIGNPSGFRRTLEGLGVELVGLKEFPDHHHFQRDDIEELVRWCESFEQTHTGEINVVLCTHKDLVKIGLPRLGKLALRAVLVSAKFTYREKKFWETIHSRMQEPPSFDAGAGMA